MKEWAGFVPEHHLESIDIFIKPKMTQEITRMHILYVPFTGMGKIDRGDKWLMGRIEIFKKYVLNALCNQSNLSFTLWLSFRPEVATLSTHEPKIPLARRTLRRGPPFRTTCAKFRGRLFPLALRLHLILFLPLLKILACLQPF